MSAPPPATITVTKSRGIYIILGILFGYLGFHNFYSGHYVSGAIKLGIFMLAFVLDVATGFYSAFSLVALVVFELWAIVEIIVVKTDGAENEMS